MSYLLCRAQCRHLARRTVLPGSADKCSCLAEDTTPSDLTTCMSSTCRTVSGRSESSRSLQCVTKLFYYIYSVCFDFARPVYVSIIVGRYTLQWIWNNQFECSVEYFCSYCSDPVVTCLTAQRLVIEFHCGQLCVRCRNHCNIYSIWHRLHTLTAVHGLT